MLKYVGIYVIYGTWTAVFTPHFINLNWNNWQKIKEIKLYLDICIYHYFVYNVHLQYWIGKSYIFDVTFNKAIAYVYI